MCLSPRAFARGHGGEVEDQGSETSTAAEGEAPTVTETPVEAVDVGALQEQIKAFAAEIDGLKGENARYRQQRREAKDANENAMKKAGEFEPLLKERDSTIQELQAKVAELEPDANARREWKAAEEASIAAAAEDLDAEGQALVAALPLEQRRAAIARLGGVKTKERPPEHPAGNPSPPAGDPSAFPAGISQSDPTAWARIKQAAGIKTPGAKKPHFAS